MAAFPNLEAFEGRYLLYTRIIFMLYALIFVRDISPLSGYYTLIFLGSRIESTVRSEMQNLQRNVYNEAHFDTHHDKVEILTSTCTNQQNPLS